MHYAMEHPYLVAQSAADVRAAFIRRTYAHVAGSVLLFALIVTAILNLPGINETLPRILMSVPWFVFLLGFMGVSWLADSWARSDTSRSLQYAGLGLYIVAEAALFLPMLWIADRYYPGTIQSAAVVTAGMVLGLTAIVFITRQDFSFLGSILSVCSFIVLGLIVASLIFGFSLGLFFAVAMVGFASCYIVYNTSNILHHYRPDQHVAASLALFASVMLLFWYVLQIFMSRRD